MEFAAIMAGAQGMIQLIAFLEEKWPGFWEQWQTGELQKIPKEQWAELRPPTIGELRRDVDERMSRESPQTPDKERA